MGSLKNKKVLVTGGNGYLGSHLVRALKKAGAVVFIIDKKKTGAKNEFAIDITDRTSVERAIKKIQPQLVFHLVASLNRERDFAHHDELMRVNYHGTINLLLALQEVRYDNFIFTSTGEVYGGNKPPFNEKMLPAPVSPYSMSKLFAETAIRAFSGLHKKSFTIFRLFNFFGDDMPADFLIPQLLNALKNEPNFKMTGGEQKRDFLPVDEVIEALMLAGNHRKARNEIFNVCSGKSIALRKLATDLKKKLKSNCRIEFGAIPYREKEIWNMLGSNAKIKSLLGFKAKRDFSDIGEEA